MTPQEKLKALRKERNLTTSELGQLCGMLQSTISKLENGRRKMDLETLNVLAKALDVSVNEFLEDNQEVAPENKSIEAKEEILQNGIKSKSQEELKVKNEEKLKEKNEETLKRRNEEKLKGKSEGLSEDPEEEEMDVTRELNILMQKFYANEGGPLFFNGIALEGEALEELEESLKFAIRCLKLKNKRRRQHEEKGN